MEESLLKQKAEDKCWAGPSKPIQDMAPMSARAVIGERIEKLSREIHGLQRLLDALPSRMDYEADEALWSLVIRR